MSCAARRFRPRPSLLVRFAAHQPGAAGRRRSGAGRARSATCSASAAWTTLCRAHRSWPSAGIQPLLTPDDLQRDFQPISEASRARLDQALQSSISQRRHRPAEDLEPPALDRLQRQPAAGRTVVRRRRRSARVARGQDVIGDHRPVGSREPRGARLRPPAGRVRAAARRRRRRSSPTTSRATSSARSRSTCRTHPIAAAIDDDTRTLYIALSVGFLVLYLGLFRLVAGASRRLRRQAKENKFQATHDSLTGLPNRTQVLSRRRDDDRAASRRPCRRVGPAGPRPLQGHQRHARSRQRRPAAAGGRDAVVRRARRRHRCPHRWRRVRRRRRQLADRDAAHRAGRLQSRLLLDEPFQLDGISLVVRGSAGIALAPRPRHHRRRAVATRRRGDVRRQAQRRVTSACGRPSSINRAPNAWAWRPSCAAR